MRAVQARMLREVGPEADVRAALAALPGGPDERPLLKGLAASHTALAQQLRAALQRCVPRPQPCQYPALQVAFCMHLHRFPLFYCIASVHVQHPATRAL